MFVISGHVELCGGYPSNLKLLARHIVNFVIPVFVLSRFDCIRANFCFLLVTYVELVIQIL